MIFGRQVDNIILKGSEIPFGPWGTDFAHAHDIYFCCMILVFLTPCNEFGHFGNLELIRGLVASCQVQPIPLSVPNFNLELITGLVAFCQVQPIP